MTLKTLKDLPCIMFVRRLELKKEAVKWVKEMRKKNDRGYVDGICINPCEEYSCDGIENFIIKFFNLTEEDLE